MSFAEQVAVAVGCIMFIAVLVSAGFVAGRYSVLFEEYIYRNRDKE